MQIPPQALRGGCLAQGGRGADAVAGPASNTDGRHYWPSVGPICLKWRHVGQSECFAARVTPMVSSAGEGPANVQKLSPAIFISSRPVPS
jgi:hypothetical protein